MLFFLTNSYNPFIYCYLNTSFKHAAKKLYQFILCKNQLQITEQNIDLNTRLKNINRIEMIEIKDKNSKTDMTSGVPIDSI
jgi:hypothetical protein